MRRFISICNIKMDRWPMNQKTLALIDFIRGGGQVPAIKVQADGKGSFRIKDGRHRVTAYKFLGKGLIEAKYGWPVKDFNVNMSLHPAAQVRPAWYSYDIETPHVQDHSKSADVPTKTYSSANQASFGEGEEGW